MQYLDATASRRCRMRFASLPYLFVLLVAFTVLTIVGILDHSERARTRQESRAHVLDHLSAKRAKLEGALNERLFLTQGLAAHVSTRPKLGEAEFVELARVILAGRTGIRAIQLAKDTVVSHIYPLDGNSEAQGLRLLEVPEQRGAVQRVLETGETVVAGPVDLVQGGVAFVSRTPIYLSPPREAPESRPYWGLATILIDTETMLREAGLFDHAAGLQYSLRGKDGLGARGAVFLATQQSSRPSPSCWMSLCPTAGGSWRRFRWEDGLRCRHVSGPCALAGPCWPSRLRPSHSCGRATRLSRGSEKSGRSFSSRLPSA